MRKTKRDTVTVVQAELTQWRRQQGGRGKPIPERFWSRAIALAHVDGVASTARALGLDPRRLERRVPQSAVPAHEPAATFIELDAEQLVAPRPSTTIELLGHDGERLRIHLTGAAAAELVALARAFWGRGSCSN